jgi:cytidylate kinase
MGSDSWEVQMSFVVAVDGPAGSGKSTVAKCVAKELNLLYIDTGAMYRMIALYVLENKIDLTDIENIEKTLLDIKIEMKDGKFYLNGKDVSEAIRSREVSNLVSKVAAIAKVRHVMVSLQREIALGKKSILDGRDIGTVVFPKADLKIYLDASPEIRASRRAKEFEEKGEKVSKKDILKEIINRDKEDMTRAEGPLKKAYDALVIDTGNKNIEGVKQEIVALIEQKIIGKVLK